MIVGKLIGGVFALFAAALLAGKFTENKTQAVRNEG